jgi:predicted RNA-binding Zn-ribbon protein involved in translation (DUF1610 family)
MPEAIRSLAGLIFGNLGIGGLVAVIFGAVLLCSLAANAAKLISHPKGMAFSAAALLVGLGLIWLMPPMPKTVVQTVREVVREIPPPVVGTLQSRIAGLEAEDQRQKIELAAQAEEARRQAEARAKAEARLRGVERQLASARQQPKQAAKPKTPAATGECIACGHLMQVGRGLKGENIKCHNCGTIMGARSARARRAYTLNVEAGRIKEPKRPASPLYADMTYYPMFE